MIGGDIITLSVERLRKEKGLTQCELAAQLGVTQGAISMIERGDRMPSMKVLLKLSKVLEVSIEELIEKEAG